MSSIRRFLNRFRVGALTREFDDEIQTHLERRIERNVSAGMTPAEAATEARRHFGSITGAREGMREARVATWLDDVGRDLRHGARVLRRQPVLTMVAVLILSLGIGANAAIFSVLNAVIFRPLPFPDPDRLVMVNGQVRAGGGRSPTIPEALDFVSMNRTLDGVAFWDTRDMQTDGGSEPARVFAARVHPSLLPLLGSRPALGRLFADSDSADGSPSVVILSDGFWRRNFGGDPNVVGRQLNINGAAAAIVGVLPPDLSLNAFSGQQIEIYVPYPLIPIYTSRTAEFASVRTVQTIARVKRGVDLAAVNEDFASITANLAAAYPNLYPQQGASGLSFSVQLVREGMSDATRPTLFILFGAVTLVLLIACLNTAQFLLAQAIERQPEVSLRSALGAGRTRLVRQFLSETLVLAAAAGTLGILQAYWLIWVIRGVLPAVLMVGDVDLDVPVLMFICGVALGTTIVCGLAPSVSFSRAGLRSSIEARGAARQRNRWRQFFIAVEVALSIVLLVQAALILRTLQVRQRNQAGFSAELVTVMRIRGMGAGPALGQTYERYLESMKAVPGLESAAIVSAILPGGGTPFEPIGVTDTSGRPRQGGYQIVSPDYFAVARIPLREGRTFAPADHAGTPPVAVVNEELARRFWPGESAIGHSVRAGVGPRAATMTIIGVVGNVRTIQQQVDFPQIFVSYLQQAEPNMSLMIRRRPGTAPPIEPVKAAIWSVEPRQAVFDIRSFEDAVAQSVQGYRAIAVLIGSFATLAFVMSVTGIFTVVSYVTTRRVREIAVRRAIGAQPADIIRLLAGQTLRWATGGLIVGGAIAVFAASALRATVPALVALDARLVGAVGITYLVVVALAMAWPAARALRIDPATALRAE